MDLEGFKPHSEECKGLINEKVHFDGYPHLYQCLKCQKCYLTSKELQNDPCNIPQASPKQENKGEVDQMDFLKYFEEPSTYGEEEEAAIVIQKKEEIAFEGIQFFD